MKRMKKILTGLLTLAMTLSMMTMTAFAAESSTTGTTNKMPTIDLDANKTGSITIHKYEYNGEAKVTGTGEDKQTPPEGAEPLANVKFKITKIADLSAYYGKDSGKLPSVEEAQSIAAKKTDSVEKATGSDGVATFDNLSLGLYLVQETEAPAQITGRVGDFLVSVPMTNATGDDWLYAVHVYPKNSSTYGEVTLQKKGKIGSGDAINLEGAQFKLEVKKNPTTWEQVFKNNKGEDISTTNNGILTTNDEGKIKVKELAPGDYRFVEVKVPEKTGYIADLKTHHEFTVAKKKGKDVDEVEYTAGSILIKGKYVDTTKDPIEVINYKPAVNKEVKDKTTNGWKNASADYSVGDKIPYRVTVDVPKNIAELKTFTLTDTPKHQTYEDGSLKIYSDSDCTVEILDEKYAVIPENNGWKITFNPKDLSDVEGKKIYISFKMTLEEGAIVGSTGNTNEINLDYSNKILPDGTTDPGTPDTTDEIKNETTVYTFAIAVEKVDANESTKKLNGVTFDLYRKLDDGATEGDENPVKGLNGRFEKVKTNLTTGVDGATGAISVSGLANGDYWLVETKTNEGYNLLKNPVNVQIAATYTETETKTTVTTTDGTGKTTTTTTFDKTLSNAGDSNSGVFTTTVKNSKGFALPTTGGIGTFVFTFAGIAMMAAAVILLITSKKKKAE